MVPSAALGVGVDAGLRVAMLAMVAAVLRAGPDDPRFAGKGIAIRFTAFALPATLLVPAVWGRRRMRRGGPAAGSFPGWLVSLFVSLIALDLAGNVFDLNDTHTHFDLVPHAHGGGAIAVTAAWLFGWPAPKAAAASIAGHALLEAQEYASDRAFGLRNVRGWWDVVGDLGAGVVGAVVYAAAYQRWVRDGGHQPESPLPAASAMEGTLS